MVRFLTVVLLAASAWGAEAAARARNVILFLGDAAVEKLHRLVLRLRLLAGNDEAVLLGGDLMRR